MSDQCKHCTVRGNLTECKKTPCGHHENWYAIEQQKLIGILKAGILEALDWNWLAEDYPKDVAEKLFKLANES